MLQLTDKNYYSLEADKQYMSYSQYKQFLKCEAKAIAKLTGQWEEEPSDALLLGSYVHAWLDGTMDEFIQTTPSLFTQKGELYAKYKIADKMIEALKDDEFCMFVLDGEKEQIITAEFAGVMWKSKVDVRNTNYERIVDLKTVKNIRERCWSPETGYTSFVEAYGYLGQLSIYSELERIHSKRNNWYEPLIVAVSKEEIPDKVIISIDEERMAIELEEIERNMERVLLVKNGMENPKRCTKCDYCRQTNRVTSVIHYSELL